MAKKTPTTPPTNGDQTAAAAAPEDTRRLDAVEHAIRVIATTLYGPNGGGPENVEAAAALFATLTGVPDTSDA